MQRPIMCIMLFLALIIFNKCFSCTFSVLIYLFCTSIMLSLLCLDVNKCSSFRFAPLKILGKLFVRDYHPQTTAAILGLPPPLLSAFFNRPPFTNPPQKITTSTKVYSEKTSSFTNQLAILALAHVTCVVDNLDTHNIYLYI